MHRLSALRASGISGMTWAAAAVVSTVGIIFNVQLSLWSS